MGFNYINPNAEIPLFKAAVETLKGIGELAGRAGTAVMNGAAQVADAAASAGAAVMDAPGNMLASVKDTIGIGREGPALAKAPSVEIQAPAVSQDKYSVSMAELGDFSAPSFGSQMASQSIGRG